MTLGRNLTFIMAIGVVSYLTYKWMHGDTKRKPKFAKRTVFQKYYQTEPSISSKKKDNERKTSGKDRTYKTISESKCVPKCRDDVKTECNIETKSTFVTDQSVVLQPSSSRICSQSSIVAPSFQESGCKYFAYNPSSKCLSHCLDTIQKTLSNQEVLSEYTGTSPNNTSTAKAISASHRNASSDVITPIVWTDDKESSDVETAKTIYKSEQNCKPSENKDLSFNVPPQSSIRKSMEMSHCYCRISNKDRPLEDNACQFDKNVRLKLSPVEIHPISYSRYEPIRLIDPTEESSPLQKEVLTQNGSPECQNFLTVFHPILHAMIYAHKHAKLIDELIKNKDFHE